MRSPLALFLSIASIAAQTPIQFVADFPPSGYEIDDVWEFNGDALYSLDDGRIFRVSAAGLQLIATAYAPGGWVKADVANGVLYYVDTNRNLRSHAAGVTRTLSSQPFLRIGDEAADADGTIYFLADDGSHGLELWRAEGPTGPLTMVADLAPGSADAGLHDFATVGRRFFCLGSDPETEVYEATANGLVQRTHLSPGPGRAGVHSAGLSESALVGSRIAGLGFLGWNSSSSLPGGIPLMGAPTLFVIPPSLPSASSRGAVFCGPFVAQLRSVGHDICCALAIHDLCS